MLFDLFLNLREFIIQKCDSFTADTILPLEAVKLLENTTANFSSLDFAIVNSGYFVDNQGRWRDKKTGRFIDMPAKPKDLDKAINIVKSIVNKKLGSTKNENGFNVAVTDLKQLYRNDKTALQIIDNLGLNQGLSARDSIKSNLIKLNTAIYQVRAVEKEVKSRVEKVGAAKAEAILQDISNLKIEQLTGQQSYLTAIKKLKRKYAKDKEATQFIDTLLLNPGNIRGGNPKIPGSIVQQNAARLAKVRAILKDTTNTENLTKKAQSINYIENDIIINKVKVPDITEILKIEKSLINEKESATDNKRIKQIDNNLSAINVIKNHTDNVDGLNTLVDSINKSYKLSQSDYDALYDRRDSLWKATLNNLKAAKSLETTFIDDLEISEALRPITKISKESAGGYRIVQPNTKADVEKAAQKTPC